MDFRLPELGEGVYEAELTAWLVKVGDSVKRGQNLIEVLTDKASMEVPSPFIGTITGLKAEPGDVIKVGGLLLTYESSGPQGDAKPADKKTEEVRSKPEDRARKAPEPAPVAGPAARLNNQLTSMPISAGLAVYAAPSVRYLARKLGVDLGRVRGSGPGGRVLIGDLSTLVMPAEATARPVVEVPHPEYGTAGTKMKLQGIRRKIAEHMVHSKQTIPHYTYVDECEVTELVRLRDGLKSAAAESGVKLTYLAFFVKAATAGLKEVPIINSSLNEVAGEIVLHDSYHIGVAVSTPNGLIVPVVHDADKKDILEIGREIERLTSATRAGKARLEDLRGGTFTITSIGGIGGVISTPVINHPEVAILGLGKVVKRPVYDAAGNIRPAELIYLSLSFDHRVVDGAIGAAFCNAVIRRLQNPALLLLPDKVG
jgi:pyruvate dehydrogenase E2 component (dihydrolipoamide acetyltransferase)/2-oxoisovalerate dehydrogenase E2 component (dihydrolipoyl transacylase)